MQELTGFGMTECLSFCYLGWKVFHDERKISNGDGRINTQKYYVFEIFSVNPIKFETIGAFNQTFASPLAQTVGTFRT